MLDNKIHFKNSSTIIIDYEVVIIARCMSLHMTMVESFCLWFFSVVAIFPSWSCITGTTHNHNDLINQHKCN